jgi:signal transduction histidine kinase
MSKGTVKQRRLLSLALIVLASASLGMLVDWRAPGVHRYAEDWLMRERGPLPAPSDIAIVAIDEKSIAAYGRFPWPRQVLAKTIQAVSGSDPMVIAVDVLFADPSAPEDDAVLAQAIGHAHNVVLGAQLVDSPVPGGPSTWLMPMPIFAAAAAGIGHVNVEVESEGVARQIAVQTADDSGLTVRALPIEALRVASGAPAANVFFNGKSMLVGNRAIPLQVSPATVRIRQSGTVERLDTGRMTIDYIGPAGSFAPVTYSVTDVLHGVVPASSFRGKYVLIGSTAASGSDRVASPFVHRTDERDDENGSLMPGVEVLANAVNTILRSRFYAQTGDGASFLWAALAALSALLLLERSQGKWEAIRQSGALILLMAAVVILSYLEFSRLLILPPIVPALIALVSAAIMGLLQRSLTASAQLDAGIADLALSSNIPPAPPHRPEAGSARWLPHGLEWKVKKIRGLNTRLIERAQFVDLAMRSVDDGLIIATPEGYIAFANPRAAAILSTAEHSLLGQNLFRRLALAQEDMLRRLVADRARVEREIEIPDVRSRRYVLKMAAVAAADGAEPVLGIVASLSDVTRQHELQQTKNDVIALVSHEMRTPLTAIQGMTELLATYDIDPARRKEISASINGEVKRLTSMITEYLDITRLESGATVLHKTPVRIGTALKRLVLVLEPVAAQRGIGLLLQVDPSLPPFFADLELLSRAVENLISNAVKYSPFGTDVSIGASSAGSEIAIQVADRGCGIPEADLSRIFEKFYRVPRVEDADIPGTGLGLALVREIAELHGGRVNVESKVNQGSTFTLLLPIADGERADSTLEK